MGIFFTSAHPHEWNGQKKSPSGIRTAKTDIELIHERLKTARKDYEVRYGKED